MTNEQSGAISLATDVTVAWLANPHTRATADDVPAFLAAVHDAVQSLGKGRHTSTQPVEPEEYKPATTARKSLQTPGRIISMIDGRPYASLKRHLKTHGLAPAQYRERYGLKADYPMVSPEYSEARRKVANERGLGRKPAQRAGASKPVKAVKAAKKTIAQALESARERFSGAPEGGDQAE